MSNKREREKRREQRLLEETEAGGGDRRARLLQLGAGAVFLVIVAVVVLIVANSGGESGGDVKLEETAAVKGLLKGIQQEKTTLGDPKAPVELIEYGDLQCPICKAYSEEILPKVIEGQVRKGEAKITFHNFVIIGPQSFPAGAAALAAGEQGVGWNYIELFYRNQGKENSGYATDAFMESVAKGAGVKNLAKWNEERKSGALKQAVQKTTSQAQTYGFTGTPSFAIKGPGTNGVKLLGTPESTGAIEEAIKEAS